ncbi:MAG: PD-(D/E)XK nuclease family protein, partial [Rhizobiaceae bacterium]
PPAVTAVPDEVESGANNAHRVLLPGWIRDKLSPEKTLPRPLNPSGARALIDKALIRDPVVSSPFAQANETKAESQPRLRGTALHKLLQSLPNMDPDSRDAAANAYLKRKLPDSTPAARQTMINAVNTVIEDPELVACFDPSHSHGEVPLMGRIEGKDRPLVVSGTIDRLAVLEDRVLVLDYKTSPNVPDTENKIPQDHVMQMALYRALIHRLYPEKSVHCLLIWTHASPQPVTMEVSHEAMDAAMDKIAQV